MANLNAKFASAVVACIVAGAPFTTVPNAANAAECLTEPRQDKPQGQHWFYRIEHGTKRHCWYLRDEDGKVSHATLSNDSPSAADVVALKGEPNQRSLEDARAEWAIPSLSAQNNATVAPAQAAPAAPPALASSPSPNSPQSEPLGSAEGSVQASLQASAEESTVSSRWPSPSEKASSTPTRLAAADSSDPDPGAKAVFAPAPPVPVNAPAEKAKANASLQRLFLVILGALALAGLTASVIYRFGHRRRTVRLDARERRAAIRESFDNAPRPPWAESVIEKTTPHIEKKTAPHIEKTAKQSYAARSAAQTGMAPERYEKIEEILAQLVKHT